MCVWRGSNKTVYSEHLHKKENGWEGQGTEGSRVGKLESTAVEREVLGGGEEPSVALNYPGKLRWLSWPKRVSRVLGSSSTCSESLFLLSTTKFVNDKLLCLALAVFTVPHPRKEGRASSHLLPCFLRQFLPLTNQVGHDALELPF